MVTIGGGEILDAKPEKHRRSDPRVIDKLKIFRDAGIDEALLAVVEESGLNGTEFLRLAARRGITPAGVQERLLALARAGRVQILSEKPMTAVSSVAFKQAADAAAATVKRFHETNPLVQGIGREELKARVFGNASELVFGAVLNKLANDKKISVAQDIIHEFGRTITLKSDEQRIRTQLLERFQSLGLQASSADEVIDALKLDRTTARKIVQLMLKENTLVKISDDMVVDRGTVDKLIEQIKALKSKNPKLGVGEFKDLTGVTRKRAIPLLEYLDRQRVTRRVGDERTIL
jgi:selenocysteine-specific elongation factor